LESKPIEKDISELMDQHTLDPDFDKRGTFVGTLNYVAPEMVQFN